MTRLTFGYSPCPNDTFAFHALVHGLSGSHGYIFEPRIKDVETLNGLALDGALDVSKVSYGVLPYILEDYALLRSGGALGRGCGPLLVAKDPAVLTRLSEARIAIPGTRTTANLLLRLFAPSAPPGVPMQYDRIMPEVSAGNVDAGLIIHESRFTYPAHGLLKVVDLGEWWEQTTGTPIPLGAIVARRSLGPELEGIERAIRQSVEFAFRHPEASSSYVRSHAQEMDEDVVRRHIDLYVNAWTTDVGASGERAIATLFRRAADAGIVPPGQMDPFARSGSPDAQPQ